jgi:tetratricopeptide (TPR) repeat protein
MLLSLAAVEHSRGMLDQSKTHAGKSAELFRNLLNLPAEQRHEYDPVLLAADVNILAVVERDFGRREAALPLHEQAYKQIKDLLDESPAGVVRNDLIQFGMRFQYEKCKTMANDPKQRAEAEKLLIPVIQEWEILDRRFRFLIPMYSESLAMAYHLRGRIRLDSQRSDEARADFELARKLQEDLVKQFSQMPGPRADLGRTYMSLAAADKPNAADWLKKARGSLEQAVKMSPDNAEIQRALKELDQVQ